MPTYEYACTRCGHHIEVVQSMSDAPLVECAACGGNLRKVFTPIGIVFKGSGFYRTDSRAAANGSAKRGDAKEPKPAASATDGAAKSNAATASTPAEKSA
jgi:putative FmdB family regulatory protein